MSVDSSYNLTYSSSWILASLSRSQVNISRTFNSSR